MVIHTILLIAGIICLVAAIVLVLWPRWVAAVPAFLGLVLMHYSYYIDVKTMTFIFWGLAALITVGLFYLSPKGEPDGQRASNLYVGLGAMAGGMLGILLAPRVMVLGVILGAAMGQLAYSRTPAGNDKTVGRRRLYRRQYAGEAALFRAVRRVADRRHSIYAAEPEKAAGMNIDAPDAKVSGAFCAICYCLDAWKYMGILT